MLIILTICRPRGRLPCPYHSLGPRWHHSMEPGRAALFEQMMALYWRLAAAGDAHRRLQAAAPPLPARDQQPAHAPMTPVREAGRGGWG